MSRRVSQGVHGYTCVWAKNGEAHSGPEQKSIPMNGDGWDGDGWLATNNGIIYFASIRHEPLVRIIKDLADGEE